MKKLIALILAAMLVASLTAWGERAIMNPQEQYDYIAEETDGSEQMLFWMVDMVNDEETIVERDGSVLVRQHFIINDGQSISDYLIVETRLYICDFGHVSQMSYYMDGAVIQDMYLTEQRAYELDGDGNVSVSDSPMDADLFNGTWENWVFPYYVPLDSLAGTREADGNMYFIVRSDEGATLMEYAVSLEGMTMLGMNQYALDEDGSFYLWMYTEVITGEGATIPQAILDVMSANETSAQSNNPA